MKYDICHVYPITSGTAGTYIDEIYKSLNNDFKQEVFVNYYYPYDYGKKYFYKFSDLSSPYKFLKKFNTLRRVIRLVELIIGLTKTLINIQRNKVKVVNYSLNSDLFIEYLFLKVLKFDSVKIIVTCHDVLPFGVSQNNIQQTKKFKTKNKFFELADYLLVHNENSVKELKDYYGISGEKVVFSPFPIMDINTFFKNNSLPIDLQNACSKGYFIVSMVGYFREEKGLKVLIDAWKRFYTNKRNTRLLLAGHFPNKTDLDLIKECQGVVLHEGFLNDNAYSELIKKSDLVVMPYIRGTNSGIPSSIVSLNTIVLTSDIEMFRNNPFVSPETMFKSEDSKDLADKLRYFYNNKSKIFLKIKEDNRNLFLLYRNSFQNSLIDSYKKILG